LSQIRVFLSRRRYTHGTRKASTKTNGNAFVMVIAVDYVLTRMR
jgi:hypothetical protein